MMKQLFYILSISFFLLGIDAKAQSSREIDSLKLEISNLQDSLSEKNDIISKLSQRIELITHKFGKRELAIKKNWRKLERYMTIEEVEKLLGKPTSIDRSAGSTRLWYGSGYLDFNAFKRLSEWSEPRKNRIEIIEH